MRVSGKTYDGRNIVGEMDEANLMWCQITDDHGCTWFVKMETVRELPEPDDR